jgi:hypothetical protein
VTGASSLVNAGTINIATGTNSLPLTGSIQVAYFAINGGIPVPAATSFWTSGTAATGGTETNKGYTSWSNVSGAALIVLASYASASGGAANAWVQTSNSKSYYSELDSGNNNTAGAFLQWLQTADGEAALAKGGSVTQGLFAWTSPNAKSTIPASLLIVTSLSSSGVLTTTAEQVPASTPIPPSVLLLGSGLLGLIGIKRRSVFNC